MKYITQLAIILTVSFAGELLHYIIPLPVPASIYGLILMLVLLITGIIPLKMVEGVGRFLVAIMPILFIPAAVGLLNTWDILRPILVPVIVIIAVSLVLVMGVSGLVTQALMRRRSSADEEEVEAK